MIEKVSLDEIPKDSVYCCMILEVCECQFKTEITCDAGQTLKKTDADCYFCDS